jgi:glycosyltransferase involved in cell wall biosynthesis
LKHPRRLLFVGRLQKEKGLDTLLDALKSIAEPVQMAIVLGDIRVQADYEEVRWQAEALTKNCGHEFEWHFALPQKEVIPLYRSAQLFICPARNEPFGNVCMEAMACGTPAVAARSGGFPALVDDGVNGRLFEADNSEELGRTITSLLDSPETIREFSRKALEKSRASFTGERAAREMIDVYNRIV